MFLCHTVLITGKGFAVLEAVIVHERKLDGVEIVENDLHNWAKNKHILEWLGVYTHRGLP